MKKSTFEFKELLVVIPHSGILIPEEIHYDHLSEDFPDLIKDVDWYTNWLYDFRDILGNTQMDFPFCSLILEANRDPDFLEESVPLKNRLGKTLYRLGLEPDNESRSFLSKKYLRSFHRKISQNIARTNKFFMLDGHSTVTSHGVKGNQIELMNYQISVEDNSKTCFCPDEFIEIYADELVKRLPHINITVNQSRYDYVYGHVCGLHSINSYEASANRVPAILQETNQKLYMNTDGTPDIKAIDTLRRTFAEALGVMIRTVRPPDR